MARFSDIDISKSYESGKDTNEINGAGYLALKGFGGFAKFFEGISDFVVGGGAKLLGTLSNSDTLKNYAEKQFSEDWFDYNYPDKAYKANAGMQFAGQVANAIGNSTPTLGITWGVGKGAQLLGMSMSEKALQAVSYTALGLSAAGNATGEAYKQTGKLGANEFAYGLLSGATEVGTELIGGALEKGTGGQLKRLAGKFSNNAVQAVAQSTAGGVIKRLLGDFSEEAFEEALSEFLDPFWLRVSGVDENADLASFQDIVQAAVVGGLSGVLMTATEGNVRAISGIRSGERVLANGKVNAALDTAKIVLQNAEAVGVEQRIIDSLKENYDALNASLEKTGGAVTTTRQKMILGNMVQMNAAAIFNPLVQREAINILMNAEFVASQISGFLKDSEGKNITITASDITKGVDLKKRNTDKKTFVKQLRDALSSNQVLQGLAVMSFSGKLKMQTNAWVKWATENPGLVTQDMVNQFVETGTDEEKMSLGRLIGVKNWKTATAEDVNKGFRRNGKAVAEALDSATKAKEFAKAKAVKAPKVFRKSTADGVYDIGNGYVVVKQGDKYRIYNQITDKITGELSQADANRYVNAKVQEDTANQALAESENLEKLASKYVENYGKLSETVKRSVRMTIRQGLEYKVDEKLLQHAAAVSAKTGLNIVFSRDVLALKKRSKEGKILYANGMYNLKNTVYINPSDNVTEATLSTLAHELSHWLWKNADLRTRNKLLRNAIKALSDEKYANVVAKYTNYYKGKKISKEMFAEILFDELQAAYAGEIGLNDGFWEAILKDDETLKRRIPSFLRKWAEKVNLKQAKTAADAYRYAFTKAFQRASANNRGSNAFEFITRKNGTAEARLSLQSYMDSGRDELYKYLKKEYGKKDADQTIEAFDNLYRVCKEAEGAHPELRLFSEWSETEIEYDNEGHPIFSTSVKNGEYELNQDFSRVCKKRRHLDMVLNWLAKNPDFRAEKLTQADFLAINKAIKAHGFEIACDLCFVDAKRYRQSEWAVSFAETYNDILRSILVGDTSNFDFINGVRPTDEGTQIDESKPVSYRKWSRGKPSKTISYASLDELIKNEKNKNVVTIAKLLRDNPEMRHWFNSKDIVSSEGFDQIQRANKELREMLDGWGGSSVPKPSAGDVVYDNSILLQGKYSKEAAFAMGGMRMNSFSDFMAHMFFDYCQAFADAEAKGLPLQAYTKELLFARLYGKTNGKLNMSGIPAVMTDVLSTKEQEKLSAGLDIRRLAEHLGKTPDQVTNAEILDNLDLCDYVWAKESINMDNATLLQSGILYDKLTSTQKRKALNAIREGNFEEAYRIAGEENVDREYANHIGTIVVGVSEGHIRKLLRDNTIRMVIPYHKSGLNPMIAKALHIVAYNDYTSTQNTTLKFPGKKATSISGKNIPAEYKIKDFDFYEYWGKTKDGVLYDGKKTAQAYLDWCKNGRYDAETGKYVYDLRSGGVIEASKLHEACQVIPKFALFSDEENYYKVLEDFDVYNSVTGEHSPQEAVHFLKDGSALPADYKELLLDALQVEQKDIDDFEDELYNNTKGLQDEVMKIAEKAFVEPSEEGRRSLPDTEYMDAIYSGDMETVQRLVDEAAEKAGYTMLATHRTEADFTVFDKESRSGRNGKTLGDAFYVAAYKKEWRGTPIHTMYDTDTYGKNRMMLYVNPGKTLDLKNALSESEANKVYDKYFAPFHNDKFGTYKPHVLDALQTSYKLIDYIKEAAGNLDTTTDEVFKWLGYDSVKDGIQYALFDENQMKSADPVTYDDQENIIPLSERFKTENKDIRYSLPELPDNMDTLAKEHFGTTTNWKETGYLLKDGTQLDFSGRHWGGSERNTRIVDHMDIQEVLDGSYGYKQVQIAYVNAGNIRIIPENPGINLSVEPTAEQYAKLRSFINRFRFSEFMVDYDDERGYTVYSKVYDSMTSPEEIFHDIHDYFENGKPEEMSDVAMFHERFSLPDVEYMQAVESGDMETAQRLVDETAEKAGYKTEHLYHGTQFFGFTKPDVENASYDSISFFVTDKEEVAAGYMPYYEDEESEKHHTNVRQIGKQDKASLKPLSESMGYEKIVSAYKKVDPEFEDASLATEQDYLDSFSRYGYRREAVESAKFLADFDFSDFHMSASEKTTVREMCREVLQADEANNWAEWSKVASKYYHFEGGLIPYNANDMRATIAESQLMSSLAQIRSFDEAHTVIKARGELYTLKSLAEKYNREYVGGKSLGIYDLYAKQDKQLKIYGNGSNWNRINLGDIQDDYNKWIGETSNTKTTATTREISKYAKARGFRSVVFYDIYDAGAYSANRGELSNVYAFFYPEQDVKSADPVTYDDDGNVIPLSQRFNSKVPDVRYSLPESETFKRYTKKEAEEIVNRIMENIEYTESERSYFEDEWDSNIFKPKLIGKSRKQAINQIFEMLNSAPAGERFNPALRIADYLIDHVIMHEIVVGTDASAVAAQFIDAMNQYRHGIHITDQIKSEAKYVFDDKANEIWMQWAAPKGTRGMDPDVIAMEMRSQGIYLGDVDVDAPAQQIFHQLLQHYDHCKSMLDEKAAKIKLREFGSEQALKDYRQGIAKDLLRAYDEFGTISKEGKAVERVRGQYERKLGEQRKGYEKRIDALKGVFEEQKQKLLDKLKNSYKKNQVENRVVDLARKLKDGAIRKYVSSTVLSNPILEKWEKELGKLVLRGNLRKANSRNILLTYEKFYNAKNQPLMDWLAETSEDGKGELDPNVLGAFEVIKNAKKETASGVPLPLSYEELKAAEVILGSAEALFRNYDAAFLEGKRYTTRQLAEDEMKFLMSKEFKKIKHFIKLTQTIQKWFNYTVEPRVVIRMLERYDPKGFLTRMYNEILQGETAAEYQRVQFMLPFEEFFKKNKGYQKRLASATIDFHGETLTLNQAIALYETTKRAQAQKGLACSGFSYEDKDGNTHHVKGTMETNLTDEDYEDNAVWFRKTIESSLTKEDKEFIKLVENFFNVESKNAKTEADLNFLGYTNVLDEFYFPIVRDRTTIARSTMDVRSFLKDVAALNNFSFNKDTKPKAATELHIGNVYDMVQTHAKQMSVYANLAQPMQTFDRVYNKNIGEKTDVMTVRKFVDENIWKGASAYLQKLFSDIQGVVMPNEDFNLFGALRGGYAKYQLGANLKVILSQTASFPTAAIVLSPKAMLRGFFRKIDFKAMDKYCPYAFTRNHDQVVVKAEGVIDKVGKIGDATTKPIQWTDRLTIGVLWNASQAQVQEEKGYVFGTEENMKEAGKLLEQVIRQTQPNYSNTERSAMMRSTHEAAKVFSMFTSAPLKQYSRLVEAAGELSYAVQTKNAKAKAEAAKKLGRAISAILIANAMYCMIGQFISWLFKKKRREDEEGNEISFAEDYLTDIAVTTIGMMPGMNQIASYFTKGYGVSGFVYDTVNDFLMDSKNIVSLIGKAASGQPVERYEFGSVLRRSVYTAGELTGIPVRNIMNTVTGMMRRFTPEAGYAVDSFFYATDYRTDLSEYMNHGNTDMAEYLLKLYTKDNTGTMSKEARDVLLNLYTQGYDVLPKAVGNTLSYTYTDANGETKTESYKLTANQKKQFKYLYSKANPVIESMLNDRVFKKLSEEDQAKAIKSVNTAYFMMAKDEVTKTKTTNNTLLTFFRKDIGKFATVLAGLNEIGTDKDKKGNAISGTKKKNVYKYLTTSGLSKQEAVYVMAVKGYTLSGLPVSEESATTMLLKYIMSLPVTQAEKAAIAERCGFTVKGNRILRKKS